MNAAWNVLLVVIYIRTGWQWRAQDFGTRETILGRYRLSIAPVKSRKLLLQYRNSVVDRDPKTLNLDPDPEFWLIWIRIQIRIQGYCMLIILREKKFLKTI